MGELSCQVKRILSLQKMRKDIIFLKTALVDGGGGDHEEQLLENVVDE